MKIGIVGAGGRMGLANIRHVAHSEGVSLSGAVEREGAPQLGKDAGVLAGIDALGVTVTSDADALFEASDAVIDFTRPEATLAFAELAAGKGKIHVIGTTGFEPGQLEALKAFGKAARLVHSPNMSLCVNLLFALVARAAAALNEDFDIEIVEMHHKHKVDAPSGTALALGRAAAEGRGVALESVWRKTRDGITGARPGGEIGFATLRGGDVVGDHTVIFAGDGERLELTHKASGRHIYASGAVHCAKWAQNKAPGYYTMKDVLGL